jgi:hypothetical protein
MAWYQAALCEATRGRRHRVRSIVGQRPILGVLEVRPRRSGNWDVLAVSLVARSVPDLDRQDQRTARPRATRTDACVTVMDNGYRCARSVVDRKWLSDLLQTAEGGRCVMHSTKVAYDPDLFRDGRHASLSAVLVPAHMPLIATGIWGTFERATGRPFWRVVVSPA